jgi:hypothetical protein
MPDDDPVALDDERLGARFAALEAEVAALRAGAGAGVGA